MVARVGVVVARALGARAPREAAREGARGAAAAEVRARIIAVGRLGG
jgi:hypothetical protein